VIRWRDALVGGTFTAVLFTLGKTLIGAYLGRSDVGSAYGAAGSLAVALLWIYYTALITLVGAEFTQVWARERGQAIVPEPGAVHVIRTHDRARQPLRAGRPA
jgi:membrane protein